MNSHQIVMKAKGLVKRYGQVTALDGADFELRAGEILASMLNTIHNLHFYQTIMAEMRAAIEAGRLVSWAAEFARDRSAER